MCITINTPFFIFMTPRPTDYTPTDLDSMSGSGLVSGPESMSVSVSVSELGLRLVY